MHEVSRDRETCSSELGEALPTFPAFAHFRLTATRDTELHGQTIKEGEKVVTWYVSSNRDETRYDDAERFEIHRIEETLRRFPEIELDREPVAAQALFVNRLKSLPVRL